MNKYLLVLFLGVASAWGAKWQDYPYTNVLDPTDLFMVGSTNITPMTNRIIRADALALATTNGLASQGMVTTASNALNTKITALNVAGKLDSTNGHAVGLTVEGLTNTGVTVLSNGIVDGALTVHGNTTLDGTNFSYLPNGSYSNAFTLSQSGIDLTYSNGVHGWLKWTNNALWLRSEKPASYLTLDGPWGVALGNNGTIRYYLEADNVYPVTDNARDLGLTPGPRWRNLLLSGALTGSYETTDTQARTNALIAASAYGLATSKTNGGDLILAAGTGSQRWGFNDVTQLTNCVFYVVANKAVYSRTNNGSAWPLASDVPTMLYYMKTNLNSWNSGLFQVETNGTNLYFLKQALCHSLITSNSVNTNGVIDFSGAEGSVRIVSGGE